MDAQSTDQRDLYLNTILQNLSMRAMAKIFGERASEKPNFASTCKLNGTI